VEERRHWVVDLTALLGLLHESLKDLTRIPGKMRQPVYSYLHEPPVSRRDAEDVRSTAASEDLYTLPS
jgi:hypothetical protein